MENPKTEPISDSGSDSESKKTPHLVLGSSPGSPTKSYTSSSTDSRPSSPPPAPPADSQVHLTIGSSPESQSNRNITTSIYKPPSSPPARSPAESPARSSVSSDHTSLTHGSSPREEKHPDSPRHKPPVPEPAAVKSRPVHEEPMALTKVDLGGGERVEADGGVGGGGGSFGGSGRRSRPTLSILRRTKREQLVARAGLGFRGFGALCCLVSFAVMAADRNKGWALDSFYRYKEFRYSMSVNVIGFIYSAAQAFDLVYHLATGKYAVHHPYRYYFNFAIDQMITYLLISASSSATTRIDDWQSNWGKDKFPDMATASVSISYLAFLALACSSLISGYTLCSSKAMRL